MYFCFCSIQEEPVEGFRVKLVNDENLFEWEVALFGPPETLYQGGYFKVSFGIGIFKDDDFNSLTIFSRLVSHFHLIIPTDHQR